MGKQSFVAVAICGLAAATLFTFRVTNAGDPPKPQKSVTVSDLRGMEVIGYLGQPLGKVVTVEGLVADESYTKAKADMGETLLRVQKVDGKELPKERVFQLSHKYKAAIGSRFKYLGYETGGFTGIPPDVFKYQPPVASAGYGFTTQFWVMRDENEVKQK